LGQRFKLFIDYQTEKNYEKQFELIHPKLIASEDCRKFFLHCFINEEDFIDKQKSAEKYYGWISEILLLESPKKLDKKRNQLTFDVQIKSDNNKNAGLFYLDVYLENR
jgi:hypothetical protein